ncbi:MAG: GNAT family N-acetyltransferase [Pseudonocardiaceae bacterium]
MTRDETMAGAGKRTATPAQFAVTTRQGLAGFDPQRWDALAAEVGFYSSHGWLSVWERYNDTTPRVVTVTATDLPDGLLAAAPCYVVQPGTGNPRYDLSKLLTDDTGDPGGRRGEMVVSTAVAGEPAPWGLQLSVGGPAGYAGGVLVDSDLDSVTRRTVLISLWSGIMDLAATVGAETVAVPYLQRGAAIELSEVARSVGADPIAVLTDMRAEIVLPQAFAEAGESSATASRYEDYLFTLGRRRRERIRSDLRRVRASGYTLDVVKAADQIMTMAPLLGSVQAHHGHDGDSGAAASYLRLCISGPLAEQALCFRAHRDGTTDAFALAYPFTGRLHMRVVGMNYAQARRHGLYFAVFIHEPVRHVLTQGMHTVELGMESLDGKLGKGAHPVELWTLAVSSHPNLSTAARRRAVRLINQWRDQLGIEVDIDLLPGAR